MLHRPKRGEAREDGKVFARMLDGKELWLTKEQYDRRERSRREYVRKCYDAYKRRQNAKTEDQRNYLGKYDVATNLYFIGVTSSGKERWGTKDQLDTYRNNLTNRRKEYVKRCQRGNIVDAKIGDPHPTKSGLFVIGRVSNRLFYGDQDRLDKIRESRAITYRKRNLKLRYKRKEAVRQLTHRYKRGDKHPYDDLLFWEYNRYGRELWYDPVEYERRWILSKERRRQYRQKIKNQSTPKPS